MDAHHLRKILFKLIDEAYTVVYFLFLPNLWGIDKVQILQISPEHDTKNKEMLLASLGRVLNCDWLKKPIDIDRKTKTKFVRRITVPCVCLV